jgi:hypothetical protein
MELLYLLQNDCESEKGYLVEITSVSESSFLKENFKVEGKKDVITV